MTTRPAVAVQLVYFEGCPHADRVRGHLHEAMIDFGLAPTWCECDLLAPDSPTDLRRFSSPTVLINGSSAAGRSASAGMSCDVEGGPSRDQIRSALREAFAAPA